MFFLTMSLISIPRPLIAHKEMTIRGMYVTWISGSDVNSLDAW